MNNYWNNVWKREDSSDLQKYIKPESPKWFYPFFQDHHITTVCDAACGFGAYSVMLSHQGYKVKGFDISKESIEITKNMLQAFGYQPLEYKVCSISEISYQSGEFDAVVAHAVIDHVSREEASQAVKELFRITRPGGLVYLSFDPLEEEDLISPHEVLPDGAYMYTEEDRKGLLFRHYTTEDIEDLLRDYTILQFHMNRRGEREVLLVK